MTKKSLITLIVSICFLPFSFLLAEEKLPGEVRIETPQYKREVPVEFVPGTYVYDVSWEGIPVAEAVLKLDTKKSVYKIEANARTYDPWDIFYKVRYRAAGTITSADLKPVRLSFDKRENSKVQKTKVEFSPDGDIHSVRKKKGKDPVVLHFNSKNQTLDPFSAAFLARTLDWKVGQTRDFDIFDGKTRYLVSLTCDDEIVMDINGKDTKVWLVSPKVVNLNKGEKTKKIHKATLYVTADSKREIIKIASEVFIGSVSSELVSFTPANAPVLVAKVSN